MSLFDGLALGGVLIVAIGAGMIYIPAGIIVLGLGMVALGVVGSIAAARGAGERKSGGAEEHGRGGKP